MARITRSAKDLWSLVTGSSVANCKELVQYELQENSERILNGILYFKKPNQSSLDTLKKSVEESHFEFANKLSKLIDIDVIQSYELFISYATYEYKGTNDTLEAQLMNERHIHSLLLEVWHYYFGERLYYLLILKHIIGHWQDESDSYKDVYESFLDKINKDNAVVTKIISQVESLISAELPTKDTHGQYMSDLLAYHWITFTLKEQCELLQLLLLYYKDIQPSIADVQKMFTIFQSHGFGLRQSFRVMLSEDNQHLVNLIGYLEGFVLIQCFELEWLFKCKENEIGELSENGLPLSFENLQAYSLKLLIKEHYLFKDENALKVLNDSMLRLGSHPSHSPILLAWLLIAQCSEVPEMLVLCSKLGRTALQLDVFEYLVNALESPELSSKGTVPEIFNRIVFSLLSAILSQFDLQHLGSFQSLLSIAVAVLKYKSIANEFWKKCDESGIGELFNYCIEMFSIEFSPLLNICASLVVASDDSCSKVVDRLKQLPVFTEFLEKIDERDIVATQTQGVWELVKDRAVYGDSTIIVPRGTLGIAVKDADKNGSTVIQWKVNVNGWQICLRELYLKLQDMNFSSAYIDQEGVQKITAACKLVKNILEMDCEKRFLLSHIINLIFSILQRYIHSSAPSLELIATCINIAALLSKQKMSDMWQQLVQIRLLPFMTSKPKNVHDLMSGICMNVGILGQLIASKECVAGEYSVCMSFLNLISSVSQNVSEDDENFLACVIFVLREIFSSFHKWYYVDPHQRLLLGQKCLSLLHNMFSVEQQTLKKLGKVQELSIHCLLHFEAGQTLLKIVCTGEDVVQQTILKQNSEFGNQVATMIRLALSVLNRLLLFRNYIGNKTSKSEVSPLEAVLFSTPGHINQPQVVLTVAHYAFQHYNPNLATLAVQLLKRFAKEFPMSLLACFGSEAESIRDHFLARLRSSYENVHLKVSILEFLTVCVAQQPGLIEMFINVQSKGDDRNKEDNQCKSCLECVKGILTSKDEFENPIPKELLCAAVEFIHALWAGHQALAMEALKKDSQFWKLACHNLLQEKFSDDDLAINAYIIRTLALEVFYSEAVRKGLNEHIKEIFKLEIQQKNLLLEWSKLFKYKCARCDHHAFALPLLIQAAGLFLSCSDEDSPLLSLKELLAFIHCPGTKLTSIDTTQIFDSSSVDFHAPFALLTAWRDFLLIIAVYKPVEIPPASRKQILSDILEHFIAEIGSENSKVLILLSELFLMLSNHWQSDFAKLACSDEGKSPMYTILTHVAQNAEIIHPREQLVVVSIAIFTVRVLLKGDSEISNIKEWIVPASHLLKKAAILVRQRLDLQVIAGVLKLPIAIIHLLNVLVEESMDWLPILKTHSVLPLLVSLFIKSLKLEAGVELSHSIITLFLSISSDKQAAETLINTGFMSEVTLILSEMNLNLQTMERRKCTVSSKNKLSQVDVYFAYIRLMTMLLRTLGNYFLQDCWNFIGVHQDVIHNTLVDMRTSLLQERIQEAILTSAFILQLSSYHQMWQLEHPKSLEMLYTDVCNCIYSTVAILCNPGLLKYLIMNKKLPDSKLSPFKTLETESLLKKPSIEEENKTLSDVTNVQQKLYELLAVLLTVLKKYSPEMCETMSGYIIDYGQWHLLLQSKFGTPSVDQDGPLSFGTILACVSMCLKLLVKNEKSPSPRKTVDVPSQVDRNLLMYILENSMTLLLSQSNVALSHPSVPVRDKQLIRRDLAAELNSMNIVVNRYLRKGPPSPASLSSSSAGFTRSQSTEFPFLKLISNLVDQLFK